MSQTNSISAPVKYTRISGYILLAFVFILILSIFAPIGVDWEHSFDVESLHTFPDHFHLTAYEGFGWALFFLPHSLLPLKIGNAINLAIHVVVILLVIRRYDGKYGAMLLTFTSPLFLDLLRTNNIDWISLAGFLLPAGWGITLLLTKPQAVGAAALIFWKKNQFHIKYLLPLLGLVFLSFLVFGNWLAELNSQRVAESDWNFAPFPFMIPLGVYLLYRGWRADDEVIAAAATPFLVPYVAPYSLAGLMAIVAAKYPRAAFYVYIGFWCYFIVGSRRGGFI